MRRWLALLGAGFGALLLAGASAGMNSHSVVRDCTPQEAHRLVVDFTRAFNAGASSRLDTLFAAAPKPGDTTTPSFQWYSTGPPGQRYGRAARDRSTLIRYFAARHRHGERLRLVWMSRGGNANGYFDFGFHVHRQARDLRRPGTFEGKGAAICSGTRARLAVWSRGPRIASD